ncbi:MAG: ABC transporter permease [Deltaproteobacteria bacterium]|nr:ABC transporter permease [Deltaproteobacteria bacterium]
MRASLARMLQVIWKEVIQIRRDRRMFGIVLMMPVLELFIFGYVVATEVDDIALAVCDYSRSAESRAYIDQLTQSGYFRITARCAGVNDTDRILDHGEAKLVLAIPPDFADLLRRRTPAQVMAAVDGSNSNTATIALGYLEQITLSQAIDVQLVDKGLGATATARHPVVAVEPRAWFNPELRSVNFMVPAITCVLLMESLVILTAMAIVREKEHGTMEQLIVTPIRAFELIAGKAVPFIGLGYINVAIVILVGTFWFQVPIAGSLWLLLALTGLFIVTCLGMGLVVSAISNTQQQASMTGQFVLLPSMFFSGFMFPIASMPPVVQKLTYLIPLRYYISISRGIFLKGAGWAELRDEALMLALYGVAIMALATIVFRKQIR